jgi:hypothetical protein
VLGAAEGRPEHGALAHWQRDVAVHALNGWQERVATRGRHPDGTTPGRVTRADAAAAAARALATHAQQEAAIERVRVRMLPFALTARRRAARPPLHRAARRFIRSGGLARQQALFASKRAGRGLRLGEECRRFLAVRDMRGAKGELEAEDPGEVAAQVAAGERGAGEGARGGTRGWQWDAARARRRLIGSAAELRHMCGELGCDDVGLRQAERMWRELAVDPVTQLPCDAVTYRRAVEWWTAVPGTCCLATADDGDEDDAEMSDDAASCTDDDEFYSSSSGDDDDGSDGAADGGNEGIGSGGTVVEAWGEHGRADAAATSEVSGAAVLAQQPACDNEPAATPPTAAATNNAGFMDRMLRQTGFELMPMNDI